MSAERTEIFHVRSEAGFVRLGLLLVLLAVVVFVAYFYPVAAEEAWPRPLRFEPEEAECEEERQERQWTRYRVPEEAGLETVEELARKLSIDESWICRANGWEGECDRQRVEAGQTLVLPLHGKAVESVSDADAGAQAP